ncbi:MULTISPECIES: hypothetical protein [Corallococcus]|nr:MULTISPECIES: hypothetical protein [Corallococcus]
MLRDEVRGGIESEVSALKLATEVWTYAITHPLLRHGSVQS